MRVRLSGSTITAHGDTIAAPYVDFPGNEPLGFPTGWTVTGSSPNRVLHSPNGSTYLAEDATAPLTAAGGSLTVTGTQGGSVTATVLSMPGTVVEYPPGTALAGGTVIAQAADPGAIGPGNLWLQVVFGDGSGDGGYGRLWVRNSSDTGWNSGGPMAYGDAGSQFLASPNDVAEIALNDAGKSSFSSSGGVRLTSASTNLLVGSTGVHLGSDANAAALLTGSADPSAGGGVVAAVGSLYLKADGTLWQKTGAGDTAWTQGFNSASLVDYQAAAAIVLAAAVNNDLALQATGTGQLILSSSILLVSGLLPTSDPALAGQVYTDGVPSAGVPKALMVSGGPA